MPIKYMKIENILSNPFRNASYTFVEEKIPALMESMNGLTYWENILARVCPSDPEKVEIMYGHHRMEAIRRMIADAEVHGDQSPYYFFAREATDKGVGINVRPAKAISDATMLKGFVAENRSEWQDDIRNTGMSILQVKEYLEAHMRASKDVDDFLNRLGNPQGMKMTPQTYSRFKTHGVGASTVAQFLGSTFSRQLVNDALQVLEASTQTKELAQALPSVTMANRFAKLVDAVGEGKPASSEEQAKVQDIILKEGLTRADVEEAIKLKDSDGLAPEDAIKQVVKAKKEEAKKAAEAARLGRAPVATTDERLHDMLEKAREWVEKNRKKITPEGQAQAAQMIDGITAALFAEIPPEPEKGDDAAA